MSQAPASKDQRSLRQYRCLRLWLAAIVVWLALPAVQVQAQDDQGTLSQLHHTAWTRKEGAPAPIPALAQSSDGWLWLGTPIGLYRFDGVRFERFAGVTRSVASLLALPTGGLWIGYVGGGAALLRDDRLVQFDTAHGLPARSVQSMALDSTGVVWAAAVDGLYRFDGSRWQAVRRSTDDSALPTLNVVAGRDGAVWARSGGHLVRVAPGRDLAEVVGSADTETLLAAAPDGGIWSGPAGRAGVARLDPAPITADQQNRLGSEMFFDREGRLWSAIDGGVRLTIALSTSMTASQVDAALEASSVYTRTQGFTGRAPLSLVQDREGAVWIGTERGLDRFRSTKVQQVILEDSASSAIVAGGDGSVWVGRWNTPPVRIDGPGLRELMPSSGSSRGPRICAARDPQGAVWLCGAENLWHIEGEKVRPVPYPEDLPMSLYVQAIAVDRNGSVWMASAQGLHRREGAGGWQRVSLPALAELGVPNAVAVDDQGRLLLGFAGARVAVLTGEHVEMLSPAQGLDVGDVKVITAVRGRHWVGGSQGVALCDGPRCRRLALAGRAELNGVSGIVESRSGELWLHGAEGITRIGAPHLQTLLREPAHEPVFERFDSDDGLDGTPSQIRPMATAAESADGRLWFTTSTNVYVIDPARLPRNTLAPPVLIRELKAGETSFGTQDGSKLPQWARSVSIRYTALSPAIPDRVRFRYRLSGMDDAWREAGGRREVFYTNLEPGAYRFDVIAANADGVWNEGGASLSFSIEPAFHQTALFKVMVAALGLTLAYALYAWRVRVADQRTRHRIEARMAERERIARDLHDTLLQGMQAVVLLLQATLEKVPRETALYEQLERLIDRTERVLVEGRDRVHQLRESGQAQLLGALEEFGRGLLRDQAAPLFHARMSGTSRGLHPVVHDEVLNIGREAISNAIAHAQAGRIELRLEYGRREFRLTVADDGCGIDAAIADAGFRSGHWGLVGMRERALKIDARLELRSEPRAGTTVELRVPARVAYLEPKSITERLRRWDITSPD